MTEQNENNIPDEAKTPEMKAALVEEIKQRAAISKNYQEQRDQATTETKRQHFHDKLVNNNEQTADLITALQKIIDSQET